jgi:hypothetical protein
MSWTHRLERVFGGPFKRPQPATDRDFRDELLFHFRELVKEKLAGGLSFDAAWDAAEQQFGRLPQYEEQCRSVWGSDARTLAGLSIVSLVVVAAVVGWLSIEVRSLREVDRSLLAKTDSTSAVHQAPLAGVASVDGKSSSYKPKPAAQYDLTGRVLDVDGKPLADARLLVIVKTWPNKRFRQENFMATSDTSGGFRLPALIPPRGQYAVLVSAWKPGYAFKSDYQLIKEGSNKEPGPIELRLERAAHLTLIVHDKDGRAVPSARLVPIGRQTASNESHMIYFQGSEPIQSQTDARGRVDLDCYLAGDRADLLVSLPGHDWSPVTLSIPQQGSTLDVAIRPDGRSSDGL